MPGKALKVSDDPKIDMDEFLVLIPGDTDSATQLSGKNIVGSPSATNNALVYDAVSDTLPWSPVLLGRYAPAPSVLPNVALLGTASADTISSSTNSADKANDGSYVSQWASGNTSGQHWLQIDLPIRYRVNRWVVDMPGAGLQSGDFKLQTWNQQGAAWLDIDHVTGNSATHVDRSVTAFDTTRVRVVVINNGISLPFGDTHARINELELYGYEVVPVADAHQIFTVPIDATAPTGTNNIFTYETTSGLIKWLPPSSGSGGGSGSGIGATATQITATNSTGSTIAANKAIHLYNNSGVLSLHLADSSATTNNNYPVRGFTVAAIPTGTTGPVQLDGILSGFSGLTSGQYYSDPVTAGNITATTPSGADQYFQKVGFAISSTQLFIKIRDEIKLAGTATAPTPAAPASISATSNSAARTGSLVLALNSSGAALAARKLVNLYNTVGGLTARLSDTSAGGPGYVGTAITNVSIPDGTSGLVQLDGILAGWSGLTSGQYYADPAATGGITTTIPATTGQHLQKIGYAISSTELYIKIGEAIKL